MENQPSSPPHLHRAEIDTARPFQSVKEAVAIFGERILVAQKPNAIASSSPSPLVVFSPFSSHSYVSPSLPHFKEVHEEDNTLASTLQKLETELEKTNRELKLLKERESENEIALASLNAELHKNMSKMAEAEAAAAAREVAKSFEKKTKAEGGVQFDRSPTLAQILQLGEEEGYFGLTKEQRKKMKKKPIIPLIGDLFSKKKSSTTSVYNPLFNSSRAFVS
ncbi:hypothetical protein ACLOJK_033229 [Asimina triloba]